MFEKLIKKIATQHKEKKFMDLAPSVRDSLMDEFGVDLIATAEALGAGAIFISLQFDDERGTKIATASRGCRLNNYINIIEKVTERVTSELPPSTLAMLTASDAGERIGNADKHAIANGLRDALSDLPPKYRNQVMERMRKTMKEREDEEEGESRTAPTKKEEDDMLDDLLK